MTRFAVAQHRILAGEMNLHREYMASFGISDKDMLTATPSLFNRTYTANMLAVGQTGDLSEIMAAVFPCAWTYAGYAMRLKEAYPDALESNYYKSWIDIYSGEEFAESFAWFYDALDDLCKGKTDAQLKKIESIFVSSVEFEYLFWDMAYKQEMSYRI